MALGSMAPWAGPLYRASVVLGEQRSAPHQAGVLDETLHFAKEDQTIVPESVWVGRGFGGCAAWLRRVAVRSGGQV